MTTLATSAAVETVLVAAVETNGSVQYIASDFDALSKAHQEISGTNQEFIEAEFKKNPDFTVYEVPVAKALKIEGDSDIDLRGNFGEGVGYMVVAPIDEKQRREALTEAIEKARVKANDALYIDGEIDENMERFIGLSVNCDIDKPSGWVSWDVSFFVDDMKNILEHGFDFRDHSDEEIADSILECWEPEWSDYS